MTAHRRAAAATTLAAVLVVTLATSAGAVPGRTATEASDDPTAEGAAGFTPLTLDDVGGPPGAEDLDAATTTYGTDTATTYELDGSIQSVQTIQEEGADVVVTLASDVVFDVDSADLSSEGAERIGELVDRVPDGVGLSVDGYTDSVGTDEDNQALSQHRAQAVADAVADARPDLDLTVTGHGEKDLKVPETGDDVAAARAQNRRVDLRYTGPVPGAASTRVDTTDITPVTGEYVPADKPSVVPVDDAKTVAEQVVEVPDSGGARVRLAVEPLVVRGSLTRMRVEMTPLDPVDEESDGISIYEMTGEGDVHPTLVDDRTLAQYLPVSSSGRALETDYVRASASVGQTVRFDVSFARPVDAKLSTLDVSLVPTWPAFEDVPVEWD